MNNFYQLYCESEKLLYQRAYFKIKALFNFKNDIEHTSEDVVITIPLKEHLDTLQISVIRNALKQYIKEEGLPENVQADRITIEEKINTDLPTALIKFRYSVQ